MDDDEAVVPHNVPMSRRLWRAFGEDVVRMRRPGERLDRTNVIRDFARWYTREPGAKLPVRPPAVKDGEDG